jgi:hypothetical protein
MIIKALIVNIITRNKIDAIYSQWKMFPVILLQSVLGQLLFEWTLMMLLKILL